MVAKVGLKKGLDALLDDALGDDIVVRNSPSIAKNSSTGAGFNVVSLSILRPGRYQPRKEILEAELQPLVDSIKVEGLLQPILVLPKSKGKHEIIAGERRYRAASLAGIKEVPVMVKDVSEAQAAAIALIENMQREDLNPLEEAIAISNLQKNFNMSQAETAYALGKSRASIANAVRLLSLNEDVRVMLERGDITVGHAKVLLALKGAVQSNIAKTVAARELSVRETEALIAKGVNNKAELMTKRDESCADIKRLVRDIEEKIGATVKIVHTPKGKGKLVIIYNSLEELDGVIGHIV